jgi:glycosyltransferase involved in cell wall biosynthesis
MTNASLPAHDAVRKPLISVVMLTMPSRAALRKLALECLFKQQDRPPIELIIAMDDGGSLTLDEAKLIVDSGVPREVIYGPWDSITAKQNAAIDKAKAPWVMLWDDDDWSAPDRIAVTATAINDLDAFDIIGPPMIHYHELIGDKRRLVKFTTPAHVVDGASAFRRALWEQQPFRLIPRYDGKPDPGNVGDWIVRHVIDGATVHTVDFGYVAMIHGTNATMARPFKVDDADGTVFDGPVEFKLVGGRAAAAKIIGEPTLRAYEAAVPAWLPK